MENRICVLGLGYVGLPLAVELAKKFKVVGFDINKKRVKELRKGHDRTEEIQDNELLLSLEKGLFITENIEEIKNSNIYIVTVPTPIDSNNNPDLTPLIKVSEMLVDVLSHGDTIVYESTVYPGCTEEVCVPILEKSGLKINQDFFVGYSPERINPGDKIHTLKSIKKVVSGSTQETATLLSKIYGSIVEAGIHIAVNIKTAEAAKVIENTQRDINIAFVNELSMIFSRIGLDTYEVLEAAGTKWNFLPFKPGLVGGHCIGVDPYYLAQKASSIGFHPEMILAGRRINDTMPKELAHNFIRFLIDRKELISQTKICVLGITFKENCPDIRNTKVIDLINELKSFSCQIDCYDPRAQKDEVESEYSLKLIEDFKISEYKYVILAVAHNEFLGYDYDKASLVYDLKGILPKNNNIIRL